MPVSKSRLSFCFRKVGLLYISHLKIRMNIFLGEIRKSMHFTRTTGSSVSETPVCISVPVHCTCVCTCVCLGHLIVCVCVLRQVLTVKEQTSQATEREQLCSSGKCIRRRPSLATRVPALSQGLAERARADRPQARGSTVVWPGAALWGPNSEPRKVLCFFLR